MPEDAFKCKQKRIIFPKISPGSFFTGPAWAAEEDPEAVILASCARLFAGEGARESTDIALQVFGARGTKQGEEIERLFRDGRM